MTVFESDESAKSAFSGRASARLKPRRSFLAALGAMALSRCAATEKPSAAPPIPAPRPQIPPMYQALANEPFSVPAVDVSKVDPTFWRQENIEYSTDEAPGTLIVDTTAKYLYHITSPGQATRYGIGVGRQGFKWSGRAHMAYKRPWPSWTLPDSMVARQPELRPYSIANGGMEPGPPNPMGARGLYIHQGNVDTLYRLHGTSQPWSIGKAVSSGCIRLLNHDVIHLADHVRDGSMIIVLAHDQTNEFSA